MHPNSKYKTTFCKYWEEGKVCPLASKCHYAHGEHELRKIGDVRLEADKRTEFSPTKIQRNPVQLQNNYVQVLRTRFFDEEFANTAINALLPMDPRN